MTDQTCYAESVSVAHSEALPWSRVFVNTGEPIEQDGLVEFRLLYQGDLLPSGNNKTRPAEKHKIRRSLHPQLRRQWSLHSGLRQFAALTGSLRSAGIPLETDQERFDAGIVALSKEWNMFGYQFLPMVTDQHFVRCALDILILRPEEKKYIFEQGDIDGQVKTIFDALQVPRSGSQVGVPSDDETPFFCLLQDDKIISEVRVSADQLLLLPEAREVKPNDAFVVIHVKLNVQYPGAIGNFLA